MRQQSERITYRGETVFIMRASLGHPTLRARSSVVSDRLNDIAREIAKRRGAAPPATVTIEDVANGSMLIRYGRHHLVTVSREDSELEGYATRRVIAHRDLAGEWRRQLQLAIDRLSMPSVP